MIIAPRENCPPDNCPEDICRQVNCPQMIVPGMIAPGLSLPFGRFVAYIVVSWTNGTAEPLPPEENSPKDKLHLRYFFPKNQKS